MAWVKVPKGYIIKIDNNTVSVSKKKKKKKHHKSFHGIVTEHKYYQ